MKHLCNFNSNLRDDMLVVCSMNTAAILSAKPRTEEKFGREAKIVENSKESTSLFLNP